MPSPFPGMDPYLEHPAFFSGLHQNFITYMEESLQDRLPEQYYAASGDRLWIDVAKRPVGPDLNVLRSERGRPYVESAGGGVAVVPFLLTHPVGVHAPFVIVADDESHESYLDIFTRFGEEERLVTTIEVLSRVNKTPGEQARGMYLKKQREVLEGKINLVEIDLLRGGMHSTAVPFERAREKAGSFDYHVCVHLFDHHDDFYLYPIRLEERLPKIEIPLMPGDPVVPLDLQAVFDRCYQTGPYRRRLHYHELSVKPQLSAEQQEWAERLLREKGLLPSPNAG